MNPATLVLWSAAALMFGYGPAYLAVVALRDHLHDRADKARREQQARQVSPEWLAVLAATEPTPIYDRLVCEQMEQAEGWAS